MLKHGTGAINVGASRIGTDKIVINGTGNDKMFGGNFANHVENPERTGRFPANLVLDEEAAAMLDEQSGFSTSRAGNPNRGVKDSSKAVTSFDAKKGVGQEHNDSGGASRFFYVAKASKSDKGADNTHPTVKSTQLMQYLIRLVTPVGGTVLDPFMGSGSTGVAAQREGFGFVGIEKEEAYFTIAEGRLDDKKVS